MKQPLNLANPLAMLLLAAAMAFAATDTDYSAALQTHFAKGTLGSPGKTRPIEMFFQNVFKSGNVYSVSGKSKTHAAEDAFSGTLTISSVTAGGSCASGETEIKGSYNLNEKESKTSGYFAGSFTACEKSGKLSKASFKGDWVKHATGGKTPCSFEIGDSGSSSFTDSRNGQKYRMVKIGKQTWMAENLNYETGDSWCYEEDDSNCDKYGREYVWEAAMKACPSGWHLPSYNEWNTLFTFVGGANVAGKKLKSKSGWHTYQGKSGNGTDEFGFSALPGSYQEDIFFGSWWHSSKESTITICPGDDSIDDGKCGRSGNSVRCVKD